jgi:hypothetical protein
MPLTVGRNDRCPCGSGKKFKQCCGGASAPPTITNLDREEAMTALERYSRRGEFAEAITRSACAWAVDDHGDDAVAAMESFCDDETSLGAYVEWLLFDLKLEPGGTIASVFLDRHGHRLNPRAADYVRRMARTHMRPYLVRRTPDRSALALIDLWTGARLAAQSGVVNETLDPVVWDVLCARLAPAPEDTPIVEGRTFVLPPESRRGLLHGLRAMDRLLRRAEPGLTTDALFKMHTPLFHHRWVELDAPEPGDAAEFDEGWDDGDDEAGLEDSQFDLENSDDLEESSDDLDTEGADEDVDWELPPIGRNWLDIPHPDLDNLTPRAASVRWRMRPRLLDLVMCLENAEARTLEPDLDWLWEELQLPRP